VQAKWIDSATAVLDHIAAHSVDIEVVQEDNVVVVGEILEDRPVQVEHYLEVAHNYILAQVKVRM
jgi:ribosome biogenesis SPOUT family RNA methylase Rps3